MKEILKLVRDGGLLSKGDITNKVGIQDFGEYFLSAFIERLLEKD